MPGVSIGRAEAAVWKELEAISTEKIADRELQKVKNKVESNLVFSEISFLNKAMNMAQYELMGDANDINNEIEQYRAISTQQIREAAASIFRKENSSTLRYLAANGPGESDQTSNLKL